MGQKFSGLYRVAAATHILRGGATYETHFANSAAHTLLGSVGGDRASGSSGHMFGAQLVIGLVTNNDDPDNMGRVRVQYPALGPDAEGAWARIASVSGGNARGLMMQPVVGEEQTFEPLFVRRALGAPPLSLSTARTVCSDSSTRITSGSMLPLTRVIVTVITSPGLRAVSWAKSVPGVAVSRALDQRWP